MWYQCCQVRKEVRKAGGRNKQKGGVGEADLKKRMEKNTYEKLKKGQMKNLGFSLLLYNIEIFDIFYKKHL